MALPITPTPVLKGKEASDFLHKIENDLKKPSTYIPTPNLWRVKELVKKIYCKRNQPDV